MASPFLLVSTRRSSRGPPPTGDLARREEETEAAAMAPGWFLLLSFTVGEGACAGVPSPPPYLRRG